MEVNGQIVTIPGIIVTNLSEQGKELGKIYIPYDNILGIATFKDIGTEITLKQEISDFKVIFCKEPIDTIFSPEENCKYSINFGESFIRGLRDRIKRMQQLQGKQ